MFFAVAVFQPLHLGKILARDLIVRQYLILGLTLALFANMHLFQPLGT